jgi:hypothetical protein
MILPTPKYFNTANSVTPIAVITPRLRFAKIIDEVKRTAKKRSIKNKGIRPKLAGSVR